MSKTKGWCLPRPFSLVCCVLCVHIPGSLCPQVTDWLGSTLMALL